MPIRAELRHFYRGKEYEATRARIMKRAKGCCEQCGKPNGQRVETTSGMLVFGPGNQHPYMFWRDTGSPWRDESGKEFRSIPIPDRTRYITVVLTMAHLDHDPENGADDNLRMLCCWCHLNFDKLHHRETRCTRKDNLRPFLRETIHAG
jgi:5-methylcytosine-specific restriction endonuclease McrA